MPQKTCQKWYNPAQPGMSMTKRNYVDAQSWGNQHHTQKSNTNTNTDEMTLTLTNTSRGANLRAPAVKPRPCRSFPRLLYWSPILITDCRYWSLITNINDWSLIVVPDLWSLINWWSRSESTKAGWVKDKPQQCHVAHQSLTPFKSVLTSTSARFERSGLDSSI